MGLMMCDSRIPQAKRTPNQKETERYAIEMSLDVREGRIVEVQLDGLDARRAHTWNLDRAVDDELDAQLP